MTYSQAPTGDVGVHDTLHFELLGLRIQVQFACLRTLVAVRAYLGAHERPVSERSPDVCVHLAEPLEQDRLRYLFRTQPAHRVQDMGITFLQPGGSWQAWHSPEPALVPFALPIMRNRFAALHAGACVNPATGAATLLMGGKEAGKTTVSLCLARQFSWSLLSDETSVVEIWSSMAWPFVRPPHVIVPTTGRAFTKTYVDVVPFLQEQHIAIADVSRIGRLVELVYVPGLRQPKRLVLDDPMAAVATVFRHSVRFGAEEVLVSRCLVQLCENCTVLQFFHGGYHHLEAVARSLEATNDA